MDSRIVFHASFEELTDRLKELDGNMADRKICIVSDTNVTPLYLEEVSQICARTGARISEFIINAGEDSKTPDIVESLYKVLLLKQFDRGDYMIALGGGVTGDITGFTASTFLRGIRFIQVPTSLVAQVDSSIGGKTGVNLMRYKNMIGTFYQPALIYININSLKTLNKREFLSGMGEVIKHGIIKDRDYFYWLRDNRENIMKLDEAALNHMISVSVGIKSRVVENDFKETSERALLNFGHTLGHAIEKKSEFSILHGECVSIGAVLASYISLKKGKIQDREFYDILNLYKLYGFKISYDKEADFKEIIQNTRNDKKKAGEKIKFILINSIGDAYIDMNISEDDMYDALYECKDL